MKFAHDGAYKNHMNTQYVVVSPHRTPPLTSLFAAREHSLMPAGSATSGLGTHHLALATCGRSTCNQVPTPAASRAVPNSSSAVRHSWTISRSTTISRSRRRSSTSTRWRHRCGPWRRRTCCTMAFLCLLPRLVPRMMMKSWLSLVRRQVVSRVSTTLCALLSYLRIR